MNTRCSGYRRSQFFTVTEESEVSVKKAMEPVIHYGPKASVCNDVFVGADEVVVASFNFFSSWSSRNSASIFWISF